MKNLILSSCLVLLLAAGLIGCAFDSLEVSQFVIEPRDYEFKVDAVGEIIATESIEVRVPDTVRTQYSIAWMISEFSQVEEGQVVVRFDDLDIRNIVTESKLNIDQSQSQINSYLRTTQNEQTSIGHEVMRVDGEVDIAQSYEGVDLSFLSRNEQIDQLGDLEYLKMQGLFYDWKGDTHQRRSDAELKRLEAQKKTLTDQLDKNQQVLDNMVITSPADGTYIYASNWWGQKVTPGSTVWPGGRVGNIPIRGKVQAKMYVLEIDAVGLEVGQIVRMRLHSALSLDVYGKIEKVSNIASTIVRDVPTKYFTIHVNFDEIDAELMRVGSTAEAEVITAQLTNALLVPQHAVYHDTESSYVYVIEDGVLVRRNVELGHQSPTLVEVVGGLNKGESVSLVEPKIPTV